MRKILLGTTLFLGSLLALTMSANAQDPTPAPFTASVATLENGDAGFYKATMNGTEFTGFEGDKLTSLNPDADYVFVMKPSEGYLATSCEFKVTARGTEQTRSMKINEKKTGEKVDYYYATFRFPAAMGTTAIEGKVVFSKPEDGNLIKVTDNGAKVTIKAGETEVTPTTLVKKDTDLIITVEPPKGHELESVTFNGTALTAEADKSYKTKMSEGEATLVVNIKGGVTPPATTYTATIAAAEHGTVSIHKPKLNADKKLEGYEEEALTTLEHGVLYLLVMKPEAGYVLGKIEAKLKAQGQEMPISSWGGKVNAMKGKDGKIEYYYVGFGFPAAMGTEAISVAVTFAQGNLIKTTANGATVKITQGAMEVTAETKVGAGAMLTIAVTAPEGKEIEKVEFAGTALTLNKDKVYVATMPDAEAALVVTLKVDAAVADAVLDAVVVYPNPFASEIVVTNLAEVAKVALVNAQGVVVRSVLPNGASELRLAVEDLPAGLYLLLLENNGAQKAIRLVK
ncbi:MAG: T9SS type A sorting domain-containing protein [Bacteroides sp.]